MEDRFGSAGALFGQPTPTRIAHSRRPVSVDAVPDEINVDILIGRPMALKIVEKRRPIVFEPVRLKIAQRE